MDGSKRQVVKNEHDTEDDASGADVFGETSQSGEKNDELLLVKPELVKEVCMRNVVL